MCGIHATVSSRGPPPPSPSPSLERRLRDRGPDHFGTAEVRLGSLFLRLTATVLALRGDVVAEQPFADTRPTGTLLFCWNGEAWGFRGSGRPVVGNDGDAIFAALTEAATAGGGPDAVLNVLRRIEGPFAFLFLDTAASRFYFGRDRLGRRSLLLSRAADVVTLSSVADHTGEGGVVAAPWEEVSPDQIYVLALDELSAGAGYDAALSTRDWAPGRDQDELVLSIGVFNLAAPVGPAPPPPLGPSSEPVLMLCRLLTEAVALRVTDVPPPPASLPPPPESSDIRIAVLFSGGLDCSVLARLASDMLPPGQGIDLINVAFENPRRSPDLYEQCPDRITGRASWAELARTCPGRAWRFIAVNVPYAESRSHRDEVISLMHPHHTEMDLSIALALYFAARGLGLLSASASPSASASASASPSNTVTTPARVLLSGLGADELFGGYSRHRVAFARAAYAGLARELRLDLARIGSRNLGRDDRVISAWGREVRLPFLDETLVSWAIRRPVWEKCDFSNPAEMGAGAGAGAKTGYEGVAPDKRVLRLLAQNLGLASASAEKKRAFGARTAKMESGRARGDQTIE